MKNVLSNLLILIIIDILFSNQTFLISINLIYLNSIHTGYNTTTFIIARYDIHNTINLLHINKMYRNNFMNKLYLQKSLNNSMEKN